MDLSKIGLTAATPPVYPLQVDFELTIASGYNTHISMVLNSNEETHYLLGWCDHMRSKHYTLIELESAKWLMLNSFSNNLEDPTIFNKECRNHHCIYNVARTCKRRGDIFYCQSKQ